MNLTYIMYVVLCRCKEQQPTPQGVMARALQVFLENLVCSLYPSFGLEKAVSVSDTWA